MRRICSLILVITLLSIKTSGQVVSVTNPANTTPNLAATYTSLANAITALNAITAISGPVTITLNAGNNQTAPAGGYAIQFTAVTSISAYIIIDGSNNTITASSSLTVGATNDAIFKLIGADYIQLENFTMQENSANTVTSPQASNNMTEFGVALFRSSTTNGAQNNVIMNNNISLNKSYTNTFGIYSNVRSTATGVLTTSDITNVSGSNFNNRIYGNNISNVNAGIAFIGTNLAGAQDVNNDIGGGSATTGNTITNWGGAAPISGFPSNSGTSYCIFVNNQSNDNVSYNTITSAAVSGTATSFVGIRKDYTASQPVGTVTSTISNNTITMTSGFISGTFDGILSQGMTALSTATINITDNQLVNCAMTGTSSSSTFTAIINSSAPGTLNMTGNVIRGFSSTATAGGFTALQNSGVVVNTVNINNNKVGDAISGAATFNFATTGSLSLINNSNAASTATINMNNNSIDGLSFVSNAGFNCIQNSGASNVAINIKNNLLGSTTGTLFTYSGVQASPLFTVINNSAMANCVVAIDGNDFKGMNFLSTSTTGGQFITNYPTCSSVSISNNTFTNLSINCTGQVNLINKQGNMISGQVTTCNNNRIVTGFTNTAATTTSGFLGIFLSGTSANGSTEIVSNNDFSNINLPNTPGLNILYMIDGATANTDGPAKTISNNIFNNISAATGSTTIINLDKASAISCTGNTFSNLNFGNSIFCITIGAGIGQGNANFSANTFSAVNSTGGSARAFLGGSGFIPVLNINDNNITNFSSSGNTSPTTAIEVNAGNTVNIYNNIINNLRGSGTSTPLTIGIYLNTAITTGNVYSNKINTLSQSGVFSGTNPIVYGMLFTGCTTLTAYNNFVSEITASGYSYLEAVRGISVTGTGLNTNYNLYNNSVYLNAPGSSGTNFGSSCIYHTVNATATTATLKMNNNIFVNTSVAKGTGLTVAYRRSGTNLSNFSSTSNYNLWYAGTPSSTNLIYYDGINSDQTLSAYQTRVSIREANSISLMPVFTSSTDLHIAASSCSINNKGIPVAGVTTDIDGTTRNATTPDIGADEFSGYSVEANAALATSSTNGIDLVKDCDDNGWTYYTDPGDASRFLFAINWDPSNVGDNVAAKTAATVRIQFDPAEYTVNNGALQEGTWTMKRYWNVDLHSATMTGFASVRFFYDPADTTFIGGLAGTFAIANSGNLEPPTWFRTTLTSFAGDAAHMNADRVYNAAGLVNVATAGAKFNAVNYAEFNSINATNQFFGGTYATGVGPNTPLPVTFNYLRGAKQNGSHLLSWKVTCNSTPKVTLVLERSSDARTFNDVYSITADAARCQQAFTHTDANPLNGINYYRLRIIDVDGKITYSNIISLLNAVKGFEVMNIAPNPVTTGSFKLNVTSATAGKMDVVMIDMQGRVVGKQTVTLIAGYNSLDMNVSDLASGTYNIYGTTAQDRSRVVRFVKQ